MSKGRKPGRPRKLRGAGYGAELLTYRERDMIRIFALATVRGVPMYQYEAYLQAFEAPTMSKKTAIECASRVMNKPGAREYMQWCIHRYKCADYWNGTAYLEVVNSSEREIKEAGYKSKKKP